MDKFFDVKLQRVKAQLYELRNEVVDLRLKEHYNRSSGSTHLFHLQNELEQALSYLKEATDSIDAYRRALQ